MRVWLALFAVSLFSANCSEAPLIASDGEVRLNGPASMVQVPGTNFAIIANTNVNLEQPYGNLMTLDLENQTLLTNSSIFIPSFAGRMVVDSIQSRIYVADRGDDALLTYGYSIPGSNGEAISFSPLEVPTPAEKTTNGVETDDNPYDVFLTSLSGENFLWVTNTLSGSVSVISPQTLLPLDLDLEDSLWNGLRLFSGSNFHYRDRRPGIGANRWAEDPTTHLLFITSTRTHDLYVIDPKDQKVEAMLDLSSFSASPGTRNMVITSQGIAFVTHTGLDAIVVLDVSNITDNGIDMEVVQPKLIDILSSGSRPDGLALTLDEKTLFVSNQGDDTVDMIDVATRALKKRTWVNGVEPGELFLDSSRNVLYVLNFLSDSISLLNSSTGEWIRTLP